jgi:SAM-dependent methyltransferase
MIKIDRLTHNWLAYKINNRVVSENLYLLKGQVMDLGCGDSPYRGDILGVANSYFGVDWSKSIHDISNVDLIADISNTLPVKNECVDTIVSFQVMEHLPEPDTYLSECNRSLRTGGILLITVPFNWHVHEEPFDYYRYTRFGLEYLLKKNGFSDIKIKENSGYWQMAALKFNYHTFRFAHGARKIFLIPLWYFNQLFSQVMDKIDRHPQETASYTVVANKK